LGTEVLRASTFWKRLRGFIARPEPKLGEGILLAPCNAVHTWWVSFPLDLVFLDENGKVLKLVRSLPPRRFTKPVPKARYVLEVPVGTIDTSGTCVGDELTWKEPPPYNLTVLSRQKEEDRRTHHDPEMRK
jgi:uncharacterized membrane protein (UPF0127 family)